MNVYAVARDKNVEQNLLQSQAFINYWRTIKPVSVTSFGLRTASIRNPNQPGRVYERTQTQSLKRDWAKFTYDLS